jgi:hypothetical protein
MEDDKEDNHKLSPFLQPLYRGNVYINNCFMQEPLFRAEQLTVPLRIKHISVIDIILRGQEEQDENDHAKANFAGLVTIG